MSQTAIRVLLVEDNDIVRLAQVLTLKQFSSIVLSDHAVDGLTAVKKAEDLKPQVILMDIGLPGIDGIEATRLIKAVQPECRILILTAQASDRSILAALAAGADAFCDKDMTGERLAAIIHVVASGAIWLDPAVAIRVLRHCFVDSTLEAAPAGLLNFGVDEKFAITTLEYDALYYQSCRRAIESEQHLAQVELRAQSELLRKLFLRMGNHNYSSCHC